MSFLDLFWQTAHLSVYYVISFRFSEYDPGVSYYLAEPVEIEFRNPIRWLPETKGERGFMTISNAGLTSDAASMNSTLSTSHLGDGTNKQVLSLDQLVIHMRRAFTEPLEQIYDTRQGEVQVELAKQRSLNTETLDRLGRGIITLGK